RRAPTRSRGRPRRPATISGRRSGRSAGCRAPGSTTASAGPRPARRSRSRRRGEAMRRSSGGARVVKEAAAPGGPAQGLPFPRPVIAEDDVTGVVATLRSGWLTTGPAVRKFEQAFARVIGASDAIALSSGTAALHLALRVLGVQPGDDVVVPTYTFTATAEVVTYLAARP